MKYNKKDTYLEYLFYFLFIISLTLYRTNKKYIFISILSAIIVLIFSFKKYLENVKSTIIKKIVIILNILMLLTFYLVYYLDIEYSKYICLIGVFSAIAYIALYILINIESKNLF